MVFTKGVYHKNRRSTTPLFRFESRGRAGFIDQSGKVRIRPQFDVGWFAEEDFIDGLSPARKGESWGFIDESGKWAIEPLYWRVEPFSEGLAAVTHPLRGYAFALGYVDRYGAEVIKLPADIASSGTFSEGLAAVRERADHAESGYIDRTGAVAIPFQFARGGPFREGLAAVFFDGVCYLESEEGVRESAPSAPSASSCGGAPPSVVWKCGAGFIDKSGRVRFKFEDVRDFSEHLAAVEKGAKWGFIDHNGQFAIEPRFESARSFNGGIAAVKWSGRWGYVDPTGNWTISPRFETADDFSDGFALTNEGFVDRTGTMIGRFANASAFVQGLAHVGLGDGEYGYINHSGKIVFRYRPQKVRPSMLPYSLR